MLAVSHILCPIDFSEASQHALDHAVMIAGWYRARLTALHVRHPALLMEPPVLFAEMARAPIETLEDAGSAIAPVAGAGSRGRH